MSEIKLRMFHSTTRLGVYNDYTKWLNKHEHNIEVIDKMESHKQGEHFFVVWYKNILEHN